MAWERDVMLKSVTMSVVFLTSAASFAQTIHLQDLGADFVPTAGNAAGDLVGYRLSTNQAASRKPNGTLVDLGTLGGAQSRATAISDDGTVVVGWAHNASGVQNTFRSVNGGAMSAIFFASSSANQAVGLDSAGNVFINFQPGSGRFIYRWDIATGISNNLVVDDAKATGVNGAGKISFGDTATGQGKYFDGGTAHGILPNGYNPSAGISDSNLTAGVLSSLAAYYKLGDPLAQTIPSILSLGNTSTATGVNDQNRIVGNTFYNGSVATVFMYSVTDDVLTDLNNAGINSSDPNHVPLYLSQLNGLTDANVFFGQYIDASNQPRYFQGYVDGMLLGSDPHTAAGDFNGDGKVDAADYVMWRHTLGQPAAFGHAADANANGIIDEADYTIWRNHFGNIGGSGSSLGGGANVPEPASVWLAILAVALMAKRNRRLA